MSGALNEILEYCREQSQVEHFDVDSQDILKIRNANPELGSLSDYEINSIWSEFSSHFFCAQFMDVNSCMDEFRKYVITAETYEPHYYVDDFIKWKQTARQSGVIGK